MLTLSNKEHLMFKESLGDALTIVDLVRCIYDCVLLDNCGANLKNSVGVIDHASDLAQVYTIISTD